MLAYRKGDHSYEAAVEYAEKLGEDTNIMLDEKTGEHHVIRVGYEDHYNKIYKQVATCRMVPVIEKNEAHVPAAVGLVHYGWVQFIDGVQTQNFARDEQELENIKMMFRLMKHKGKAEYVPVFVIKKEET